MTNSETEIVIQSLIKTTTECYYTALQETGRTHIGGLEAVDDGRFAAVVQTQTQDVHLLLQSQPSSQLVKQPHWRTVTICCLFDRRKDGERQNITSVVGEARPAATETTREEQTMSQWPACKGHG